MMAILTASLASSVLLMAYRRGHIAYRPKSPFMKRQRADGIARKHNNLTAADKVDPRGQPVPE